jgi:cobalt-zinc-cadmium efflux system membrane fusion protein
MMQQRVAQIKFVALGVVVTLAVLGAVLFAVPPLRAMLGIAAEEAPEKQKDKTPAAQVIYDANGKPGLQLTRLAVQGLGISPVPARHATGPRPLPPQVGTINFDNETLFSIPSRFPGEIAEIRQIEEDVPPTPGNTSAPQKKKRPLRYGDRVKQGELLAVVHSTTLGNAKAALVDAVTNLKLSTERLERHYKLFADGSISLSTLRESERQQKLDSNAALTAERNLLTLKLTEKEVKEVKDEAERIAQLAANDDKFKRDPKEEAEKWARVEIRVPIFDEKTKDTRELTVVEKNTNLYAMVDPINTNTPLFRVADLNRLQIWVHPPEEYLPALRKMLDSPATGGPTWNIEIQAAPQDKVESKGFTQIAPSIEPNQHTPMLMGYLDNPGGTKYIIGQFVTATLFVAPEPDTVEIPTTALNEVNGEALVFVQPDPAKDEFFLRRVAVVQRFKDVVVVRMKLTPQELRQSQLDVSQGKRALEPLLPGERVVTQGVVELTAALEDLLTSENQGDKN